MVAPSIPPFAPIGIAGGSADQWYAIRNPNKALPSWTPRHVTNRTALCNAMSGSQTQSGGRCWQISFVPINGNVRIYFWNGYILTGIGTETATAGTMVMGFSITYGGATSATYSSGSIAAGAVGYVDVPAQTIPANKKFFINWQMAMTGGFVPAMSFSNCCDRGNGDQYLVGATGFGNTQNTTYLGAGEAGNWLPAAVVALSNSPIWACITDSLGEINDVLFDPAGGRGMFGRAISSSDLPHVNYAAPGDRATTAASGFAARSALLTAAGATVAFLNLGRNDVTNGRTATQIVADRTTLRGIIKAAGVGIVIDTTITPYTTSTDGFNSTANQTVQSATQEIQRATFNDYCRGAAPYYIAGTLTNGSATISAIAALEKFGVFPGCVLTSPTSGITGGTTALSVDYTNGAIVMSAAFTGTTTSFASVTATQPAVTGTFPLTNSDGLVDMTLLEGAKSAALVPLRNGGVWLPGTVTSDGLHPNTNGYETVKPVVMAAVAIRG